MNLDLARPQLITKSWTIFVTYENKMFVRSFAKASGGNLGVARPPPPATCQWSASPTTKMVDVEASEALTPFSLLWQDC